MWTLYQMNLFLPVRGTFGIKDTDSDYWMMWGKYRGRAELLTGKIEHKS